METAGWPAAGRPLKRGLLLYLILVSNESANSMFDIPAVECIMCITVCPSVFFHRLAELECFRDK